LAGENFLNLPVSSVGMIGNPTPCRHPAILLSTARVLSSITPVLVKNCARGGPINATRAGWGDLLLSKRPGDGMGVDGEFRSAPVQWAVA